MCAQSKTKWKGKGKVMLGEMVGRVLGVGRGREWVAVLLSMWSLLCLVERKNVSSVHMWVGLKIEGETEKVGVYIGIWTGQ